MYMTTKPYEQDKNEDTLKVGEPVAAYGMNIERMSLGELGIAPNVFDTLVERAERDFASGHYTSSDALFSRIKQQRGW